MAFSEYKMEKLEANELSQDITALWEQREGKKYYLVNEKYTSTVYLHSAPILPIHLDKETPGYISNTKIIGANEAVTGFANPWPGWT